MPEHCQTVRRPMETRNATIGVFGLWHLGCVLSASWSKLGFKVIGFDYSQDLIEQLNQNEPPIFEPHLKETLENSYKNKSVRFTRDVEAIGDCDYVFLAYDTPVLENDESDLAPLRKAIDALADILKDGAIVIVSSQTPIGTCQQFRADLRNKNKTVELVYSPENLRLGQAIECYLKPDRIIVGADSDVGLSRAVALFHCIGAEIIPMNIASAEMVKHAINAFLATSITFANHLADLCEASGANIMDVIRGTKSDARIGERAYLSPGIGFSGGTLGRDLRVLADLNKAYGLRANIYESILDYNSERKTVIIAKIKKILGEELSGKTICALGLTYKPGTSTLRRSLPLEIVELLCREGAKLRAYDPKADYSELDVVPGFVMCSSIDDALSGSNLAVLFTEWSDFKEYDWQNGARLMQDAKFFDTKNFLADSGLSRKGFQYTGIGFVKT